MNTMKKWLAVGLIGLSSAAVSMAVPSVTPATETFDVNGNWQYQSGSGAWNAQDDMSVDITQTPYNGSLRLGDLNNVTVWYFDVFGNANTALGTFGDLGGGIWAQDWTKVKSISFDVIGTQAGSIGVSVSDGFGGNDFNFIDWTSTAFAGGWTYTVDMKGPNWGGGADFSGMQQLSINIAGGAFTSFDNFTVTEQQGVPEPETVWMILAVLVSLGVTFRRQLTALVTRA